MQNPGRFFLNPGSQAARLNLEISMCNAPTPGYSKPHCPPSGFILPPWQHSNRLPDLPASSLPPLRSSAHPPHGPPMELSTATPPPPRSPQGPEDTAQASQSGISGRSAFQQNPAQRHLIPPESGNTLSPSHPRNTFLPLLLRFQCKWLLPPEMGRALESESWGSNPSSNTS